MSSIRAAAVLVLMLTTATLALAAGEKVEVPVTDGGVVKVKPVCLGDDSALEVEVEIKGMSAGMACSVSVSSVAGSGDLPGFETDHDGEGETEGHVRVSPVVDEPLKVTVTIACEGRAPIQVEATVTFEKSCEDDAQAP